MDVAIDKTTLGEVSRKQRGKEGEAVREGEKDMNVMEQSTAGAKINVHAAANHWQMPARAPSLSVYVNHITGCIHALENQYSCWIQDEGKRFLALSTFE